MAFFLVHGTPLDGFESIARARRLKVDPGRKYRRFLRNPRATKTHQNRIFFQALDRRIVPRGKKSVERGGGAMFWGPVVLVFDAAILDAKGQRGTYGHIGSYDSEDVRRFGPTPRTALSEFVFELSATRPANGAGYLHSHEVTLERDVDLTNLVAVLVAFDEGSAEARRVVRALRSAHIAAPTLFSTMERTYLQIISWLSVHAPKTIECYDSLRPDLTTNSIRT